MRPSAQRSPAPLLAATILAALAAALALPALAQAMRAVASGAESPAQVRLGWTTLVRTIWAPALIGALATILALPAAWWLRRAGGAQTCLLLAPLLLPSYLVYVSWGLLRAPGTLVGDAIAQGPPWAARAASDVQAIGALSLWAWPVGALVLAIWTRRIDQESLDAMRAGGASAPRRLVQTLWMVRWGLPASAAVVSVVMLGSAVPLHVAQVETYAITLWRLLDETGGAPVVWLLALPLLALASIAGAILARGIAGARVQRAQRLEHTRATLVVRTIAVLVWALSTLAPLAILLASLRDGASLWRFWALSGPAAAQSAIVALVAALAALLVAVLTSVAMSAGAPLPRRLAILSLCVWLALALAPGVLLGDALLRASLQADSLAFLTETRAGAVLAHIARFAFVGAAGAALLCALEPAELGDLRRTIARPSLRAWALAVAPWQAAGLLGAALAAFALSFHEIEAAIVVTPPGADNLPRHLLNLLHYNREEELTAASVWMLALGLGIGALVVTLSRLQWTRIVRTGGVGASALVCALALGACDDRPAAGAPIPVLKVIGEAGTAPGQFIMPRAIDAGGGFLWIIDRSGRVQRIEPDSGATLVWEMPRFENGYPCGVTYGPDGLLYVADTHEHRVVVFRPTETGAEIVRTIGGYGRAGGEFIYPTDVAVEPDETGTHPARFYVSEYGGNDRVSVFDAEWNFLFAFGNEGSGQGAEFARPQSLAFDLVRRELLVVDATNHRVGRFTRDGSPLAWHGAGGALPGSEPGEFRYPYGCAMLPDGSVLVLEFGANRVQRIDWETGAPQGAWGTPGRGEGELAQPWAIAALDGRIYVADAGNQRVVVFSAPAEAMRGRAAR